eukprot:2877744-Prymnesium_polylepis.1
MHRDDVRHPQPQSHAQASRFFDEANVVTLRKLDTSDASEGEAPSREGLATYLEYHGGLMRATSKMLRLPAEERLELAWRTLFWS